MSNQISVLIKLLDALTKIDPQGSKFEVRVAGKVADTEYYEKLLNKLESIKEYVTLSVLGYLEESEFLSEINSSDVVIALRNPTMGETSAIAMRAMQLGKPLVVTDVGWYSELPEFVCKVDSSDNGTAMLTGFIQEFVEDKDKLSHLQRTMLDYSSKNLSFNNVCAKYLDVLYTIRKPEFLSVSKGSTELLACKLFELGLIKELEHKPHRTFIYEKLTPFFNGD